ncbi:MAG: hypothetical protein ACFFB2_11145 [Promethearchaeota archaeon]
MSASYFANGSAFIDYKFLNYGYNYQDLNPDYFPYPSPFSLRVKILYSEWGEWCNYLLTNLAHRWQSWKYWTPDAMCDGGGYQNTLTITWNATLQTKIRERVDDDTCSGQRICTIPVASSFLDSLLDFTNTLIFHYFDQSITPSVTLESKLTETTDFVSGVTHESIVSESTDFSSGITWRSGFVTLVAVLVSIPVLKRFQAFSKK